MNTPTNARRARRRINTGLFLVALMLSSGCLGATEEIVEEPEPTVVSASVELEGTPTTTNDQVIAHAVIEQGVAPFIANWRLDGALAQTSNSLIFNAGFLSEGTHTIEVELTDSMGASTVAAVLFTLLEPNRAPKVSLYLPAEGIAEVTIDWSVEPSDPDGDELTVEVDFADGATFRDLSGQHIWGEPGTYSVIVTATDPLGYIAVDQKAIRIDHAEAPTLSVSTNPSPQGRIHLTLAESLTISTRAEDTIGHVSYPTDRGDGSASDPAMDEAFHQ